jgi:oxygen-dependent protoporphyrinogen oxidase
MENKHGSIFVGMIKGKKKNEKLSKSRLLSFKEGMQELPKRLAKSLMKHPILGFKIKEVKSNQNGQWWVRGESEEGKIFENLFDEVVSTLPAHTLSEINWHGVKQDDLISTLTKATHPPLALTFLGFKRDQISHPLDGFGFLIPEAEKRKVLGTLFSSTLFPNRAPKHHSLLTSFVGGERNPELCNLSDDEIIALSISENSDLLEINGLPNFAKVIRWPKSIPLPDHSMGQRKAAAFKLNSQNKGLFFKGAHIFGAPLPNCLNPE